MQFPVPPLSTWFRLLLTRHLTPFFSLWALGLSILALPANAQTTADGLVYSTAAGEVTITGYTGLGGAVIIPSSIGGDPVTTIGPLAFQGQTGVTGITIPSSVTSIGYYAFSGSGLTSMAIPSSVTSIESEAFQGCGVLTSMTLTNGVTSIGDGAFASCTGLTSITIPSSVTDLGNGVFDGCTDLASVTILGSITSFGTGAFFDCTSLTNVTIPGSVTTIESEAFHGCTGLTTITIPESVTLIESYAFYACTSLTQITFLGNAPTIDSTAFQGANSGAVITYPAGAAGYTNPFAGLPAAAGAATNSLTRLVNISTRAPVGTGGSILIPGFVIQGSGTETLLIRGDGPSLTGFGVTGVLAHPILSVLSGQTVIASNTGWGTNPNPAQITSVAAQVGAFSFASGSADCAVIVNLPAGTYTVEVSGVGNTTGVALAEVYEVSSTGTRLVNISTRAQVGTGGNIIIAGFVISGSGTEQLLVRGDGPSLTPFGVMGVLAQPSLSVLSGQTTIASNTGWGTNANPAQISSVAALVGAFALPANSADSAVVISLPAGAYTAEVSGVNTTTGIALVEVYEVPND